MRNLIHCGTQKAQNRNDTLLPYRYLYKILSRLFERTSLYGIITQALVGAPGASVERVKALWPAILGLALGLEEITQQATRGEEDAEEGGRGITAVARETYIEALVAAGR